VVVKQFKIEKGNQLESVHENVTLVKTVNSLIVYISRTSKINIVK